MKSCRLITLLLSFLPPFVGTATIKVSRGAIAVTNDPFSSYLWAHKPQNQVFLKDVTDIRSETFRAKKTSAIGSEEWFQNLTTDLKIIRVAVIDSGIDPTHPDLTNAIWRTDSECEDGLPPLKPTMDHDRNGFKGDCMGWNFVSEKPRGDNRMYDDVGHGTHVAGIIAATVNNDIGVAGFGNHIKVLPLRVFGKDQTSTSTLSQNIEKALRYAIKKNVDIINLSLGWPLSMDRSSLRRAFALAKRKGIFVVAAAGNNNSDQSLMPCSYDGVICVGALRGDSKITRFTNYGGHVDLLAPGDHILSTYPMNLKPSGFSIKGYSLKNGSSQSAPYVSGVIASLKSQFPTENYLQIYARLMQTAKAFVPVDGKHVKYGAVDMKAAMNFDSSSFPMVRMKGSQVLTLDADQRFSWLMTFENPVQGATVFVSTKANGLSFDQQTFSMGGQPRAFLKGKVTDLKQDTRVRFTFEVRHAGKVQKVQKDFKIVKKADLSSAISVPIQAKGIKVPVVERINGQHHAKLRTLPAIGQKPQYPFYYLVEPIEEGLLSVKVLSHHSGEYQPFGLEFPDTTDLLSLFLVDVDLDGHLDIFARTLVKKGDEKFIRYSFYNRKGEPLFGEKSHWKFVPKNAILDIANMGFYHAMIPGVSSDPIRLPFMVSKGRLPDGDQDSDPFANPPKTGPTHIYKLTVDGSQKTPVVSMRALDSHSWHKQVRKTLQLKWNEKVLVHHLLKQSQQDFKQGRNLVVLSSGKNFVKKHFLMEVIGGRQKSLHRIQSGYRDIGNYGAQGSTILSALQSHADTAFLSLLKPTTLSVGTLDPRSLKLRMSKIRYRHASDRMLGVLSHFQDRSIGNLTFIQSKSSLLLHVKSLRGVKHITKLPIDRVSFVSGQLFSELFHPLVILQDEKLKGALYVDQSKVLQRSLGLVSYNQQGKIMSPIAYQLSLPKNCTAMNPSSVLGTEDQRFNLLCLQEGRWKLNWIRP